MKKIAKLDRLPAADQKLILDLCTRHTYPEVAVILARPRAEGGLDLHTSRSALSRFNLKNGFLATNCDLLAESVQMLQAKAAEIGENFDILEPITFMMGQFVFRQFIQNQPWEVIRHPLNAYFRLKRLMFENKRLQHNQDSFARRYKRRQPIPFASPEERAANTTPQTSPSPRTPRPPKPPKNPTNTANSPEPVTVSAIPAQKTTPPLPQPPVPIVPPASATPVAGTKPPVQRSSPSATPQTPAKKIQFPSPLSAPGAPPAAALPLSLRLLDKLANTTDIDELDAWAAKFKDASPEEFARLAAEWVDTENPTNPTNPTDS